MALRGKKATYTVLHVRYFACAIASVPMKSQEYRYYLKSSLMLFQNISQKSQNKIGLSILFNSKLGIWIIYGIFLTTQKKKEKFNLYLKE